MKMKKISMLLVAAIAAMVATDASAMFALKRIAQLRFVPGQSKRLMSMPKFQDDKAYLQSLDDDISKKTEEYRKLHSLYSLVNGYHKEKFDLKKTLGKEQKSLSSFSRPGASDWENNLIATCLESAYNTRDDELRKKISTRNAFLEVLGKDLTGYERRIHLLQQRRDIVAEKLYNYSEKE